MHAKLIGNAMGVGMQIGASFVFWFVHLDRNSIGVGIGVVANTGYLPRNFQTGRPNPLTGGSTA
jgi:hypothetical protein